MKPSHLRAAAEDKSGSVVLNRQRRVKLHVTPLREFAARLSREVAGGRGFSLCLVSDAAIRRFNRDFRGHDAATDVLSFADGAPGSKCGWAGDLVVSAETARRQARRMRHSVEAELKILALHGLLHLTGLDHELPRDARRMARIEQRWRRHFALPEGLIERAAL